MASIAIQLAGGVIGSFIPGVGSAFGAQAAGLIAGLILQPDGETRHGPRLSDLRVTSSTYGKTRPIVNGYARVAGNVIWSKDLIERSTEESVGGGKSGGGGGSFVSYEYFWSGAVSFAEGTFEAIPRLWADVKLVYNKTGTATGHLQKGGTVRFYLGTFTQEPDPLIEADVGVGNASAHRGEAYIVCEDYPLADHGNRVPSWSAELVENATTPYPYQLVDNEGLFSSMDREMARIDAAHGFGYFGVIAGDLGKRAIVKVDLVSAQVVAFSGNVTEGGTGPYFALGDDGAVFVYENDPLSIWNLVHKLDPDTLQIVATSTGGMIGGQKCIHGHIDGLERILTMGIAFGRLSLFDNNLSALAFNWQPSGGWPGSEPHAGVFDDDGVMWLAAGRLIENVWLYRVEWQVDRLNLIQSWNVDADFPAGGEGAKMITYFADDHSLFVGASGSQDIIKWDIDTETTIASLTGYVNSDDFSSFGQGHHEGRLWTKGPHLTDFYEIDLTDLTLVRTLDVQSWRSGVTLNGGAYDAVTHSFWGYNPSFNSAIGKFMLDRVDKQGIPLADAVRFYAERAGIPPARIDVTGVAGTLRGYVFSRIGPARVALEQLAAAFDLEMREHDWTFEAFSRSGVAALTIPYEDLGAFAGGGSPPASLPENRAEETELARRMAYVYFDVDADYQDGVQSAQRQADLVETDKDVRLEFAIVMNATEAAQSIDRLLYMGWIERVSAPTTVPPKYLRLEGGDVVDLTRADGTLLRARITRSQLDADYVIGLENVGDDQRIHSSGVAGGGALGFVPQTVDVPGATELALLDIPMLRDQDNTYGFYMAVWPSSAAGGFRGAVIHKSADRISWSSVTAITTAATAGRASSVLAAPAIVQTIDVDNSVTVRLVNGTLASAADQVAVVNGANVALIGDEIVGFRDVVDNGNNSYTLSHLLRGRLGTEHEISSHALGERFVLLETAAILDIPTAAAEVGVAKYYRAISIGAVLDSAASVAFTNTAVRKRPYSPVRITGSRAGDDLTINWKRRTRRGYKSRDFFDQPLFESAEQYQIDILDGAAVVRTITVDAATTTIYTGAQQTTDFGSAQSSIDMVVYMKNAEYGRGPGTAATL